ncbi:MAG: hypothetical protein MUE47_07090 [Acidobacteria bacterium]|nr:hypothetical protein [Acidobacteriota bacterium]
MGSRAAATADSPRANVANWVAGVALLGLIASTPARSTGGPAATEDGWWARAAAAIESEEYEIAWQEGAQADGSAGAWQAPNRAHGFRATFSSRGVVLQPRTTQTAAWHWGLALAGWGRDERIEPLPAAVLRACGHRIELDRGALVEWYVNGPRGLEHGFTLTAPPAAEGRDAPLVLVLELEGTLTPQLAADGQAIEFRGASGPPRVRYAELAVRDARGRPLPARLAAGVSSAASGNLSAILLQVDDRDADYPLEIDPLATSPSWNAESNQASARFGAALAAAGDVNGDGYSDVISTTMGRPTRDACSSITGRLRACRPLRTGRPKGSRSAHASARPSRRRGT